MTVTDRRSEVRAEGQAEARDPATRLRVRRQPRWIAAGVLAMCLGGLGAAALYAEASRSSDVIVLTRNVARGEVLTRDDLRIARVGNLDGISSVGAAEIDALSGQRALVDLTERALLPAGGVGVAALEPGGSQIGLRLAPGRIPHGDLPQGTTVLLVPLDDPRATSPGQSPARLLSPIPAEVLTPPEAGPDGLAVVLDVRVDSARAAQVAALAAVERIALVKEGT